MTSTNTVLAAPDAVEGESFADLAREGRFLAVDIDVLAPPSPAVAAAALENAGLGAASNVTSVRIGNAIRRQFLATLRDAAERADLSNEAEFHDLFDLIMGLGVSNAALAEVAGCRPELISRYRNRHNKPATAYMRRALLREALALATASPT